MKPHERRAAGAYPYFKLAMWSDRNQCWRDGREAYATEGEARAAATDKGKQYRISTVTDAGRVDGNPFIAGNPPAPVR